MRDEYERTRSLQEKSLMTHLARARRAGYRACARTRAPSNMSLLADGDEQGDDILRPPWSSVSPIRDVRRTQAESARAHREGGEGQGARPPVPITGLGPSSSPSVARHHNL
jgi:hypothetical protein